MVEINMPIGGGPGIGNGNGGGCKPGVSLERLSLAVSPTMDGGPSFVPVGTHVTLSGSAQVRIWLPDCTSRVSGASIEWELFYQAVGGQPQNATSILQGVPTSNIRAFDAGLPGVYNVSIVCPTVAAATGAIIYAGPAFALDGTAKVWVQNEFQGTLSFEGIVIHAVLVMAPQSAQVLPRVDPIRVNQVTLTEESGDGFFDSASGHLDLHLVLNVSGPFSGTINITLSTDKTIMPPQDSPVAGQRRNPSGHLTLVGDAPIVGPPGTTHGWLDIDGQLVQI